MDTNNSIILNWFPIQHFEKLSLVDEMHMNSNRAGIYIWGFMDDNNIFWPYYVGKHRNVPFRLCEHLSNLKGGNYTIYTIENLFSFNDIRFYEPHVLQNRVLFIKDLFNANQYSNVQNMINRFHFTYSLIDSYDEWGNLAEKSILNCFSKKLLINSIYGKPSKEVRIGNLFDIINPKWDNRNGEFDINNS